MSPALWVDSLPLRHQGSPQRKINYELVKTCDTKILFSKKLLSVRQGKGIGSVCVCVCVTERVYVCVCRERNSETEMGREVSVFTN